MYGSDLEHHQHELESDHEDLRVVPLHGDDEEEAVGADKSTKECVHEEESEDEFVPKSERRGLFARLVIACERRDARTYPQGIKWFIVAVVAIAALIAPIGGSIFLPAMQNISDDLHTTPNVVNISYGMYTLSLGIFPLWWSALSEIYGRRSVYVVSFALYVAFTIGCALSTSIGMLIAFRILSGAAASSVQAVGAGTISDLFITTERSTAIGYYYLGPLCGPLFAPIFGGLITSRWHWQGTQWFLVIVGATTVLVIVFGLPETLREERILHNPADIIVPVSSHVSTAEANELHRQETAMSVKLRRMAPPEPTTLTGKIARVTIHPFKSLKFLKFPPVPLAIVYSAYCFFCLYFLNVGLQRLYSSAPYNFKSIIVGLMYIPNSLGYIIASQVNGRWSDHILKRSIKRNGVEISEARIAENVYIAAALYPVSLLIFGWTAHAHTFWLVPLIGTFLFGVASMIIFGNTMTYLVDTLPGRGSSAVALNNLLRMTLAAIATFIADPLEDALGYGWLYTMLAIGSILAFGSVVAIKLWGPKWRKSFDLASIY